MKISILHNLLFLAAFCYSNASYAQFSALVEDLQKSGKLIFTKSFNEAEKPKKAAKSKDFSNEESIYMTLYLKSQTLETLSWQEREGIKTIAFDLYITSNPHRKVQLHFPISSVDFEERRICWVFSPDNFNVQIPFDYTLVEFIKRLPNKPQEFMIQMVERPQIKGAFWIDFSNGKGKYKIAFDALETEQQRQKEEAERLKREEEARLQKLEAERQAALEARKNRTDWFELPLLNTGRLAVVVDLKTDDIATNARWEVGAEQYIQMGVVPGDEVWVGGSLFHTVTAANNGFQLEVTPPTVDFQRLDTRYAQGSENWREWILKMESETWSIDTKYQGEEAWRQWWINTSGGRYSLTTKFSGNNAWQSWVLEGAGPSIEIRTRYSGDNAWQSWDIYVDGERYMTAQTTYNSTDAWQSWELRSESGQMDVDVRFMGEEAWRSWDINDEMLGEEPLFKFAGLFCCYMSAILPQCVPEATCAYKGIPLYGKVKFVEYGEDLRIKYVDYNEDLRVEFVSYGANDCGEWQMVDYSEDLKVKIVEYGEDLRVKKVNYNPGMR